MTYWTFLVISYGLGPLSGYTSTVVYPSAQACGDAMLVVEPTLSGNHPDLSLHCMPTGIASGSIRPMPRPEGLVHG